MNRMNYIINVPKTSLVGLMIICPANKNGSLKIQEMNKTIDSV